jgi:hypothetical protein
MYFDHFDYDSFEDMEEENRCIGTPFLIHTLVTPNVMYSSEAE